MSFIRARQRSITALFPHQGNKQFLVPKRIGGSSSYFRFAADSYITFNPVVPISSETSAMLIELYVKPDSFAPPYDSVQQGFIISDILSPLFYSTQRQTPGQIRASFWDAGQFAQAAMSGAVELATYSWDAVVAPSTPVGLFTIGPTQRPDWAVSPATGQFMVGTNLPPLTSPDNAGTFLGVIAEIKIWLTNRDGTGQPDHYWKINEGEGTAIIDYGTSNSPGTLVPGTGYWITGNEPVTVVGVGDSNMVGHLLIPPFEDTWIKQQANYLTDAAVVGANIAAMAAQIDTVMASNPEAQYIVCNAGINNIAVGDTSAAMQASYQTSVLDKAASYGKPVLQLNLPPAAQGEPNETERGLFNAYLAGLATAGTIKLVDADTLLANPSNPSFLLFPDYSQPLFENPSGDGTHYTNAAHDALAPVVRAALGIQAGLLGLPG
jgi:hypothetical protein